MTNRWWIYQQERFPIFKNGLLILALSAAAVGYSALLRGEEFSGAWVRAVVVAFVALLLGFFQLRVADEFKDFETDAQYRAYRPVPRGLVTLRELGLGAIATAIIQLGLSISQGFLLVLLLTFVWGYALLMFKEFFVPQWLKTKPLIYLLSHAVIMPLLALYASACEWSQSGQIPAELGWFLGVSFFNSLVIEIGRKIRAPQSEELGVETYTALWGSSKAVGVWLLAMGMMVLLALRAGSEVQAPVLTALGFAAFQSIALLLLLLTSLLLSWRFLTRPTPFWAKLFETVTGLGTLGVYLVLGVIPVLLKTVL